MAFIANEFEIQITAARAVYVDRKSDNSGTYVYTDIAEENGFTTMVPISAHVRGEWMYYSQNVRDMIKAINPSCEILETPVR